MNNTLIHCCNDLGSLSRLWQTLLEVMSVYMLLSYNSPQIASAQ